MALGYIVCFSWQLLFLLKLLTYALFDLGKWCLARKLSFSFMFPSFVEYRFLWDALRIMWISLVSVVMYPFSFLIVLIWCSFIIFISLHRGLSILFIFSNNLLFLSLVHCIFCLSLIYLSTQFDYFLFSTPFGHVCFFFVLEHSCVLLSH